MKTSRFDEIVFLDNFFRSSDNLLSSNPVNRRFLFRSFGLPARRLGLSCRELYARTEGGELDVSGMMKALHLPAGPPGWARSCAADLSGLVEQGLFPRLQPRSLVIGWGLPPSLMHLLDQQGLSFLDIEIAPQRFASHLSFCARTNDERIEAALDEWRIDDESYWQEATILQGYFSRRSIPDLFHRQLSIGLFCGQSAIDLALVRDGAIARPIEVLDPVRALATQVDLLVFKPHPYEPDLRQLAALADEIPNAVWSDANFYALLCADNLRFVCGLSSSALREAPYFLKQAVQLIVPDRNNPAKLPAACSEWIAAGPGITSVEFLARINAEVPPSPSTCCRPQRFPEDALDRTFELRWGLDARSTGLRELPALVLHRTYALRDGSLPAEWLAFGWGERSGAGVAPGAARACLVLPLLDGCWSDGGRPTVWLNGRRCDTAHEFFDVSVRTDRPLSPRLLMIQIEFKDRARFLLQELRVEPPGADGGLPQAVEHEIAPSRVIAAALACLLLVAAATLLATNAQHPQLEADASRWSELRQLVTGKVQTLRGDVQGLLQHRHDI